MSTPESRPETAPDASAATADASAVTAGASAVTAETSAAAAGASAANAAEASAASAEASAATAGASAGMAQEPGDMTAPVVSEAAMQEPGALAEAASEAEAPPGALAEAASEAEAPPSALAEAASEAEAPPSALAEAAIEAEAPPSALAERAADVAGDASTADAVPDTAAGDELGAGPGTRGDDLRAAVGLPAQPEPRGAGPRGRRGRTVLIIGAIALLGALVAALVFLGRQNRQRYYLVCGEDDITAAQGRSFPPWGRSALAGKAWQAIPRPLDAPCEERVFDSREGLARSFGEMLVARADAWVIAREDGAGRDELAEAQAELDQAQRVLRELRDPAAGQVELSGKIQRLRGDLDYWHARDRIDAAMAELARAAEHLGSATTHDPQHNREDAQMWQRLVARLQAELGAGPAGTATSGTTPGTEPPDALPPAETPAQPGIDAPSVPLDGGLAPEPGSTSDAGPATPPSVPAEPEAPPPDAGTRRGGLLI